MSNEFTVEDASAVRAFLANYPLLFDFIEATARELRPHFPESQFVLRLVPDPESDDVELVLFVQFNGGAKDAFARLTAFDERWGLISTPAEPFHVNLEFV